MLRACWLALQCLRANHQALESMAYTRACGNRTFEPYTIPFRTPLTSVRASWYFGSSAMRSAEACSA